LNFSRYILYNSENAENTETKYAKRVSSEVDAVYYMYPTISRITDKQHVFTYFY